MKHKRKRPKDRRAGCLLCKPHKSNGFKHMKASWTKKQKLEYQITKEGKSSVA